MKRTIHFCVVDDHCDVVPFLHACWKAKIMPLYDLHLVHIDSHPDLAPPPTSVERFYDIQHLYDVLEGVGGISEFILPLIYNGHFSSGMTWLHPPWSKQLQCPESRFYIGDNSEGKCVVTFQEPYYFDDGIVYDAQALRSAREVILTTCTKSAEVVPPSSVQSGKSIKWVLDICLDYLTVSNPFLVELEDELSKTQCAFPAVISVISDMYENIGFRSRDCVCRSSEERRLQHEQFKILAQYFLEQNYPSDGSNDKRSDTSLPTDLKESSHEAPLKSDFDEQKEKFLSLFACKCSGQKADGDVVCSTSDEVSSPQAQRPVESLSVAKAKDFLSMIPALPPSVRQVIANSGVSLLSTLPHHPASDAEISTGIDTLREFVMETTRMFGCGPEVICIARSDGDGFTTTDVVDDLQARVIEVLERISVSHWENSTLKEHDIRTDCFVKCREIFLEESKGPREMSSRKRKLLEESGFRFSQV